MKRIKLFVAVIVTLINSSAVMARDWWKDFYVGADAQVRRMDFKGGYGDNLFAHHSPQGNIYIGLKFNNWVGVEVGYEATSTRTRLSTLTTGDVAAGTRVSQGSSPMVFRSKAKITGPHADLVGFYLPYESCPTQLFAAVGVSVIKGTFERQTVQSGTMPRSTVRKLSDHKSVLRLTGGIQYMFGEHLGVRATIGWVNTGKMVVVANDGLPNAPEVKPKNSTVYGLGMLWKF